MGLAHRNPKRWPRCGLKSHRGKQRKVQEEERRDAPHKRVSSCVPPTREPGTTPGQTLRTAQGAPTGEGAREGLQAEEEAGPQGQTEAGARAR